MEALSNRETSHMPHTTTIPPQLIFITKRNGIQQSFDREKITRLLQRICHDYGNETLVQDLYEAVSGMLFEGMSTADIEKCCVLASASLIERDPVYDTIATRLLLQQMMREIAGPVKELMLYERTYRAQFVATITQQVMNGFLDNRMLQFPLEELAAALELSRDNLLGYMGLQTLYQRYFLKQSGLCCEMPQMFWMRTAMGLALQEDDPVQRAYEFYDIMSQLRYIPSTPTLFHSGFPVAQLSSCYLTTINDDLAHIFKCMGDNAQLAKWAGGIGTDWTNIRATGAFIRGIKASSQGVIPYLKIANDIVSAITKSGIRRGGKCAYLEVWHFDIEDFLDLRRNTGDERRRTHDMNTAMWIPDLFMKRVIANDNWTLFSPDETPDLHEIYGAAFENRYHEYEEAARHNRIKNFRVLSARALWRKMLTRLFETGHPWITFKDPSNIRSPQDHVGVVHSSNLCTEVILNTSSQETAVCNLGSINIAAHTHADGTFNYILMRNTVTTAIRMLDNVIDLSFYPTKEAAESNKKHRPIGLGIMGLQDALFTHGVPYASQMAYDLTDELMEHISYYAIEASSNLAQERETYATFPGSKWHRGIFPFDTIALVEQERGMPIDVSRTIRLDWDTLKQKVTQHGMRNSNTMAIAPTATIATIAGCYPSFEPIYRNIYVKSNVSGEFTVINRYLVNDLKKLRLWNQSMLDQIKYYDGNVEMIPSIPDEIKQLYKTAFELDPEWLIEITAVRGKWIDQSQSHNVFLQGASGKKLNDVYMRAWKCGLKTTYYLRTLGATQIEKATLDAKEFGFTQNRTYTTPTTSNGAACGLDESCESCQ